MKMNRIAAGMVTIAALAFSTSAFSADAPAGTAAKKPASAAKKTAKLVPVGDVKWGPLMPDMADGPQIAFVQGDAKGKGNVSFFLKLPNGSNSGVHTHNADQQATVISGMVTNQLAGEADDTAKQMGPGSWWWQPAKEAHFNRCVSADGCVVFIAVNGPFSFIPVKDAKAAKMDDKKAAPAASPAMTK